MLCPKNIPDLYLTHQTQRMQWAISADVFYHDCNEDVLLTPVISTAPQYPFCPINDGDFGSDLSLFSTSTQSQDFDPSILPLLATQPMEWSSPSPLLLADSALSYFLPNQDKHLTTTTFDFDKSSQPRSFNISSSPQLSPQILARSPSSISPNPSTKNPATTKNKPNRPLLPSEVTTSTDTSDLSLPNSPHTSHDPGPSSNTEKRISRRRAQNCAAQRAFRARKEKTIKESTLSLDILKIEHQQLLVDNSKICSTVENLQSIIKDLRQERGVLSEASVDNASF